ncbi:MAG TPA: FkbM family methyltransferase [Verrucomicrobiae bacterium]|jgi:hypothetical protein
MSIFKFVRHAARQVLHPEDFFLRNTSGIIHVGSSDGKEAELYSEYNLNVLWIEPNPKSFQTLTSVINNFKGQTAKSYLLADVDDKDSTLAVGGDPGEQISLKSIKLSTLVVREKVDVSLYDALVMDVQGADLRVLNGAADLLSRFQFIKTKAAENETYPGCCTVRDIDTFLTPRSFRVVSKKPSKSKTRGGSWYDVIYSRESWKKLRSKN